MIEVTDVISCELIRASATDLDVVNAARISLDTEHPEFQKGDDKLIDYLMRHRHGSPFEHGFFKFKLEVPIFEFRDHVRHRIGHSYNEMSGRYTELPGKFYLPKAARTQVGKPGAYVYRDEPEHSLLSNTMKGWVLQSYQVSWDHYQKLLSIGIAKEQARIVLPVGIYTKVIWSCNPRSLMHFLGLRIDLHAMEEIRVVAWSAAQALKEHMPITYNSFMANGKVSP